MAWRRCYRLAHANPIKQPGSLEESAMHAEKNSVGRFLDCVSEPTGSRSLCERTEEYRDRLALGRRDEYNRRSIEFAVVWEWADPEATAMNLASHVTKEKTSAEGAL